MRLRLVVFLLLCPGLVAGQAFVRVGAAATMSSAFANDFLVEPLSARQSLAPTGVALVGWQMSSGYRIGVEARYAMGNWEVVDREYTDELGGLKTLTLAAFADGPLTGALRWEVIAGVIRYMPEHEVGVFGSGAPSPWTVGGGVSWSRPLTNALNVVVSGRYDYHGFNTRRMDADGYASRQSVHRAGLMLAVERGF